MGDGHAVSGLIIFVHWLLLLCSLEKQPNESAAWLRLEEGPKPLLKKC